MTDMTRRALGATAFALALTGSVAFAQQADTVRIRGTIEKVDGETLTVKARDGKTMMVKLAANAPVTAMVKSTMADIKQGTFVGVTAMPQPDGSQKAIGLHIFMEAQKGKVPTRHFPWDREPGSTMTNADVEFTVAGVDGQITHGEVQGRREESDRSAHDADRFVRSRHHGRPQGRCADDRHRGEEVTRRHVRGALDQRRPRRCCAAHVISTCNREQFGSDAPSLTARASHWRKTYEIDISDFAGGGRHRGFRRDVGVCAGAGARARYNREHRQRRDHHRERPRRPDDEGDAARKGAGARRGQDDDCRHQEGLVHRYHRDAAA